MSIPISRALPLQTLGLAALTAAWLLLTTAAQANPSTSSCVGCHNFGGSSSSTHQMHLNLGLPESCSTCHVRTGDTPVTANCASCHTAPTLAQLHQSAGAASCTGCHPGTPPPDPRTIDDDGDGMTENQGDCNDTDASIFAGALEVCGDGIDQSCSGADLACPPEPGDLDNDGDGFSSLEDCNDNNAAIYPGAAEVCDNGLDENCDPGDDICTPEEDADSDGFSVAQGDCNDTDDAIHPGADEVCGNGIDENCNPADDVCPDVDRDGVTVADGDCNDFDAAIYPGAAEITGNGIDENCNGMGDDREATADECTDPAFEIRRAVFTEYKDKLEIKGRSDAGSLLSVLDADRNEPIAAAQRVSRGSWRLTLRDLATAPRTIIVESAEGCSDTQEVRIRKRKKNRSHDPAHGATDAPIDHPFGWTQPKQQHGEAVEDGSVEACLGCHSVLREDKGHPLSCYRCHGREWDAPEGQPLPDVPEVPESQNHAFGWANPAAEHADAVEPFGVGACTVCHGTDPETAEQPLSCYACHGRMWDEPGDVAPPDVPEVPEPQSHTFGWDNPRRQHRDYAEDHGVAECLSCHSIERADRDQALSCYRCHGREW